MPQPSHRSRPRDLRASDADREAYAHIIEGAYAEGRLDAETLEQRSGAVWSATTVGQLDDLVHDVLPPELPLPTPTEPVVRPRTRPTRAVAVVGAAAAVVLITVLAWMALPRGADSPTARSGSTVEDMFSGDGLRRVATDLAEAAGTQQFTEIGFYGEYAVASAPGAPGADRLARLDWRDGDVSIEPGPAAEDDLDLLLFDVTSDLDYDAIGALAAGAAEQTGISDVESAYLTIERVSHTGDHQIEARIYLSNDYQNASIIADHAGSVISMEGPGIEPDPTRFLVAAGMRQAMDAVITRIGGPEVGEILFYGEYVSAEAPPEPGAPVLASFSYRGGTTAIKEATIPSQPDDVPASLFSLDDLDPDVMATLVAEAVEQTGITDAETTYVYVERDSTRRGAPVQISVYVSGPYDSGRVVADLDGTVREVS